jgi:hypothetical protein
MPRLWFFTTATIAILLTFAPPLSSRILAQDNPDNSANDLNLFYALLQSVIGAVGVVAGAGIALYLYWREQKETKLDTISRSCQTILWELADNKKALTGDKHQKISYHIAKSADENAEHKNETLVLYTNAYLHDEAYRTLINSGSFSYFDPDTQYTLVSLYGRIKSHNELLTYTDELQDRILITGAYHGGDTDIIDAKGERLLFSLRERYDLALTKWEKEITGFILEAEKRISAANPRK